MDNAHIEETAVETTAPPVHADRRRPGRTDFANPALIELLRAPVGKLDAAEASRDREDDLAPVRGIRNGVLLSVPLWSAIAAMAWLLLGR